jgi:hypothetical protein
LGKEVIDFVAHLETLRSDARTNDGVEVLGLYAVGGLQHLDVAFNDAFLRTFPSGVNGRDNLCDVIPKENGDAIGCAYADADIGQVGRECIDTIQGKRLLERILTEESLVNNDRLGAMRLMQRHEETGDGDGNTAISCGGEGGDMRGSGVDVHFVN